MSQNENNEQSSSHELSSHSGARYWGNVEVIEEGDNYRISRVEIKPRHGIKPQIHYHRNEHWVVVSGVAKVTCGDTETLLNRNESTYVPAATLHKVENPGLIPLVILEIQNGEYLGEDDIERPYDLNLIKPTSENK
ncbi:phosphomannose isomerase type II C-terminal cupin domain [Nostoc sp. FACHB-87]|uniref:Phosphomannose isomerase type II C-terminal cupin domain n=1 Tax=Nostoc spongiaeforme FACHB-130 TaxID=1357510 RepID=A0ABR8FW65_9NOSO|nr:MULTISPECIES: phosphomannose isomerase type II C-terminal cupin domain [Nostocales]MBD2300125.1 phosphomannose isomerase type II C-terminal cupin domain [Nostoc sp. FACHB-190]MBD2455600.1 phosphomannose isomerase type II C-terminal cupin domain [Nostoc sp. FACHB-87]MBD2477456.1 phosphomannose isomerase type II C-terminal cupin domain [Anabaena sp. FACHB-83]MBD2487700.1 phosphomannose isomerase type II C-terminal cupin domain [Aulosira sp. FACHB-615]MBD2595419.1 phosphomannose isomerase type